MHPDPRPGLRLAFLARRPAEATVERQGPKISRLAFQGRRSAGKRQGMAEEQAADPATVESRIDIEMMNEAARLVDRDEADHPALFIFRHLNRAAGK